MTGDCHVRFYQGLGAQLPRPTNRLNLFEKTPLDIALSRIPATSESDQDGKQLILL